MQVDSTACAACTKCIDVCPLNLIKRRAFDVIIQEGCTNCGECEKICPCGAIIPN